MASVYLSPPNSRTLASFFICTLLPGLHSWSSATFPDPAHHWQNQAPKSWSTYLSHPISITVMPSPPNSSTDRKSFRTQLHGFPPLPNYQTTSPLFSSNFTGSLSYTALTTKNLLPTYKALHNLAPTYLSNLLHEYTPSHTPHSGLLTIPTSHLSTMGARAFSCSAQ